MLCTYQNASMPVISAPAILIGAFFTNALITAKVPVPRPIWASPETTACTFSPPPRVKTASTSILFSR